jgi:hypothetical protein
MSSVIELPLGFKRLGNFPLDCKTIIDTYEELVSYASNVTTSSYPGQICFCTETESAYMIRPDRSLWEIKSGTTSSSFWGGWSSQPTTFTATGDSLFFVEDNSIKISSRGGLRSFECTYSNLGGSIVTTNCVNLSSLVINDNNLTSLNCSNCSKLETLTCNFNNLTAINLYDCTNLSRLDCGNNWLSDINLTKSAVLNQLNCEHNINLRSLDVSNHVALTTLVCHHCEIATLNIDKCPNLIYLDAEHNHLNTESVDHILEVLVQNQLSNGFLNLAVHLNGIPSLSGMNNVSILRSRSWGVQIMGE